MSIKDARFVEYMQRANTVILGTPDAVQVDLVKTSEGFTYAWLDNSAAAKRARKELREVLTELWQLGAYNYAQLAKALRVDEQTIQSLLDEEFINKYGL